MVTKKSTGIKLLLLAVVAFFAVGVVGCVEGEIYIDIKEDGSADMHYEILFEEQALNMLRMSGETPIEDMKKDIKGEEGVSEIREIQRGGMKGVRAEFEHEDVADMELDSEIEEEVAETTAIDIEEGLFKNTYHINIELEGDESLQDMGDFEQFGAEMASGMIDFSFVFDLPIEAKYHNADTVENGVYTWNIDLIEGDTIELELEMWNFMNLFYFAAGLIVVVLTVGLVLTKIVKNRDFD